MIIRDALCIFLDNEGYADACIVIIHNRDLMQVIIAFTHSDNGLHITLVDHRVRSIIFNEVDHRTVRKKLASFSLQITLVDEMHGRVGVLGHCLECYVI